MATENMTTKMIMTDDVTMDKDHAKILSIFILGVGSFVFGIMPTWVSRQNQQRYPLLITIFLCFGGGVLLATSIVHMLAEVKEDLPQYAEIVFCIGFFIIYAVDEIVHFFCGEAIQHSHASIEHEHNNEHNHEHDEHNNHPSTSNCRCMYGSDLETQSLLIKTDISTVTTDNGEINNYCDDGASNSRICHVSHSGPCEQVITGVAGLLCALSLHSFLEGLAIGVQDSSSKVLLLLGAVSCHKFVVGFCLGVELRANPNSKYKNHIIAILIFSMGSVLGIFIGMIVDMQTTTTETTIPILQGLAGGTLLYVTVCEVLPREKARWHQNQQYRAAGLIQFIAVALGFSVMTLLNFYLGE